MNSETGDCDIDVKLTGNFKDIDFSPVKLEKLVKFAYSRFKPKQTEWTGCEVSIAIVDDEEIRKLNKTFLSSDSVTDCLSFDLSDEDDKTAPKSFELVVNAEKAVRQAQQRGHSPEAELALYVTHGLLHNLGFDDNKPAQAKKMHDAEDRILQQLGFGLVYNNRR